MSAVLLHERLRDEYNEEQQSRLCECRFCGDSAGSDSKPGDLFQVPCGDHREQQRNLGRGLPLAAVAGGRTDDAERNQRVGDVEIGYVDRGQAADQGKVLEVQFSCLVPNKHDQ